MSAFWEGAVRHGRPCAGDAEHVTSTTLDRFLEKKRGGLHLWKRRYFIYRDGNLSYFVDQAAAEANAGRRAVSVSSVVMERGAPPSLLPLPSARAVSPLTLRERSAPALT